VIQERRQWSKTAPTSDQLNSVAKNCYDPHVGDEPRELHVCMGLNSCQGHDAEGQAPMAGMGSCSTVFHVCHGENDCRGQGGCGYLGSEAEQGKPGEQSCSKNGSCASPINVSRVSSGGQNKGKSVWKLARQRFEQRMYEAEMPFGPSPGEGYPDDLVPPEGPPS
jgi:hypothetical protein